MRQGIEARLRPDDLDRLEGMIADRKSRQHHVWWGRSVLLTADGGRGDDVLRGDWQGQAHDLALAGALYAGRR